MTRVWFAVAGAIIAPGAILALALLIVGAIKLGMWFGLTSDDLGVIFTFGSLACMGAGWGWYFGRRK